MGELNAGESSGGDGAGQTPKQMMSRFYVLQEERIQTYQMFEEGFQAYLKCAPNYNFPLYRQLVHEITETFNKISADILDIKGKFSAQNNLIPIAEIINKIQTAEKNKLEMTAKLQLCRQKQTDEPSETVNSEVQDLKQKLQENKEYLIEQMEELKYESEDLYTDDEPTATNSTTEADR